MEVGTKISCLRKNRKLSQPELAHHLGISQTALCEIESGKTKKIDFLLMDKVCKFFEVDSKYFIDDKGDNFSFDKIEKNKDSNIGCKIDVINNNISEGILESIIHRLSKLENVVSEFVGKKE